MVHSPGKERVFDHSSVEVHYGNILSPDSLEQAFHGVQAVVHLVGIIRPTRGASFDRIHREGTANVVSAAVEAGVRECVYVSAMGAMADPSYPYFNSKHQAELEVKNSGVPFTILRPSVLFGKGDEFLTSLAALIRLGPLTPVIGAGKNRMQPVAADDVARCAAHAVGDSTLKGKTINLGGPHRLSYDDLMDEVALAMDRRCRRVHIPKVLAWPAVAIMERILPSPPVTTDQLRMLGIRNVSEGPELEQAFGFTPKPLRGNIDYVKSVTFGDAVRMLTGLPMSRRKS